MYRWRADTLCRDPLLEVVAKAVVGLQRRITPQILSLGVFSSKVFCSAFLSCFGKGENAEACTAKC